VPVKSRPSHALTPALRRFGALGILLGALGTAQSVVAQQSPPVDPVSRFLSDRGIISAAAAESSTVFIDRMRDTTSDMVLSAMNFLGVPYRRGGSSADEGFDCSGFTRHIFELSLGMVLPHRADDQAKDKALTTVKRDELKPGDLVFFNTMRRTFSHVGIYVGEGKFIHAPRSGSSVRVEDMREAYWNKRFTGARRATLPATALDQAATDAKPTLR